MPLPKALSFISGPKPVASEVAGEKVDFYPVSVTELFKLRAVVEPLAGSIMVLFRGESSDREVSEKNVTDETGVFHEKQTSAADLEVVRYRDQQRADAIKELLGAFADEKNLQLIGRLLLKSVEPKEKFSDSELAEFIDSLTPDLAVDLVLGFLASNKRVMEPFQKRISKVANEVRDGASATQETQTSKPSSPDLSGEDLRMAGSNSAASASAPTT